MISGNEKRLENYIESSRTVISKEGFEEVRHYYEHGEYEMAFEGLLIELINDDKYPDNFNFLEWEKLGINYSLNIEPVFDGDIWKKFLLWGNR